MATVHDSTQLEREHTIAFARDIKTDKLKQHSFKPSRTPSLKQNNNKNNKKHVWIAGNVKNHLIINYKSTDHLIFLFLDVDC